VSQWYASIGRIPAVGLFRHYQRRDLRPDLVAGLVLATMLVPQGMAYAELTGLPPATGIYTTVAALVAYAVFGPNRRLILGPDSSLAPIIAAVVLPLAVGDAVAAAGLASSLSVVAGVVCVAAGLLRLGVVTDLLAKPVRIGYLNGIAVIIFVSQLPPALGFSVAERSPIDIARETVSGVASGQVVPAAVALSVGSVAVILGLRWFSEVVPGVLLAVAGSIAVASLVGPIGRAVETVGTLPAGFPAPAVPDFDPAALRDLMVGAVAVALISFADTGSLSTATALKSGERLNPNSEIKALGAANLVSGVLGGFPTSASSSRTAVAMAVGARTQLAGLVAAAGVVGVLAFGRGLLEDLPSATLAAIVVTASLSLFDWAGTVWLWRVRRVELLLALGAFAGVLVLGVLEGVAVAIALALANFVRMAWRPHSTELGRVEGTEGYHDRERHPEAEPIPGLLIVRYDAPLFFANAPDFGRRLQEMLRSAGRPIERVLVVANAINDIDTTGAEILAAVLDDLDRQGITFAFAGLKGPVKDQLQTYGLYDRIGSERFFPNTISAVDEHSQRRSDPS
jgi:high affinity sulfate transporter 1